MTTSLNLDVEKSVWDRIFLKGPNDFSNKIKFDWFSLKAYSEYKKWIDTSDEMILDAGCGTGRFCYALARDYVDSQVYGVDISETLIRENQSAAEQFELWNLNFKVDDIFKLSFPDNTFDLVFNEGVIEHFENYEDAFAEMVRVTKPGGKIIVGVPNRYCFPHTIRKKVLKVFGWRYEYGLEKSFTHAELKQLFSEYNIQDIEFTGYYFMQSIIRLFWVTWLGRKISHFKFLSSKLKDLGRRFEDYFIARIDRMTDNRFSIKFGFEIVIKGIKP